MDALTVPNFLAYSLQIAALVAVASLLPTLARLNAPASRYLFWQGVLAACLLLPWVQAPRRVVVDAAATASQPSRVITFAGMSASAPGAGGLDGWTVALALVATGACLRLTWVIVGFVRLQRLRRAGVAAPDDHHTALRAQVAKRTEIRYVDAVRQPVTFGIHRPIILLPSTLRDQPADVREAVVAHELSHVRRRDALWVLLEEGVRAAFWFHPAIWWVIGRIRLAREYVVDECAIALTGSRRAYLQALLAFAEAPDAEHASAFGGRRNLFDRITQIAREDVMSSKRLLLTSGALAVAVVVSAQYVVKAFPLTRETAALAGQQEPGPIERLASPVSSRQAMPRKTRDAAPVFPEDPVTRETTATVTVRATVDQSGSVVEARIVGLSYSFKGMQHAVRGDDIPAQLAGAVRPALHGFMEAALDAVRQWQYEPLSNGPVRFDTTIHFAGEDAPAPAFTAQAATDDSPIAEGAIRVGNNIKPPTKVLDARPVYPEDAKRAEIQGVVIMEIRVEGDGTVSRARVLRSIPVLDAAALDAVRQWRFTPTLLNGAPTPIVMTVTVQFML
jgi:TonB family protein